MINAIVSKTGFTNFISNDNCCSATSGFSTHAQPIMCGVWGDHDGCVFRVGEEMYFVPTQQVMGEGMLYITCDTQRVENSFDGWRSRLTLGDGAGHTVE